MNPKDHLAAFRVLIHERATTYIDTRNVLREMDDFYLAASNFDEQIRDPDEVIYESDFQEFVVHWAMRLIAAGTRITGPKQSLQILINQHGPAAVLQAVREYEKAQKGDLANDSNENADRDVAVLELESV